MFGIGIDVSGENLDVAVHEQAFRQFKNNKRGWASLIKWLQQWPARQVVLEASGGYEQKALDALHGAGLPMAWINPSRGRSFASATGKQAKTDRIDTMVLANMADALKPTRYVPPAAWQRRMSELCQRRRHLVQMRVSEHQRMRAFSEPSLISMLNQHLREIQMSIKQLDSINRIAPGRLSGKSISALVGVAPMSRERGTWKGRRSITGGRAVVREALYMAALTAKRHEPRLKEFFESLANQGKPGKAALVAVMRKLLVILNARKRDEGPDGLRLTRQLLPGAQPAVRASIASSPACGQPCCSIRSSMWERSPSKDSDTL